MQEYQTSSCNSCVSVYTVLLFVYLCAHVVASTWWQLSTYILIVSFFFIWGAQLVVSCLRKSLCPISASLVTHFLFILSSSYTHILHVCVCLYFFPCGCNEYKPVVRAMEDLLENVKGSIHPKNKIACHIQLVTAFCLLCADHFGFGSFVQDFISFHWINSCYELLSI